MPSKNSMAESWGFLDHDPPASDSDADDDLYHSDDNIPEPPPQRTSSRRVSATSQRQLRHSSRSVKAYTPNRTTPSRRTPVTIRAPEFIMPTPEGTPSPAKRQTKRKISSQYSTPIKPQHRSPKRARTQQPTAHNWLEVVLPTLFYITKSVLEIGGIVLSILKIPLAILIAVLAVRAMIESAMPSFAIPNFLPGMDMIPSTCSIPGLRNFVPGCVPSGQPKSPSPVATLKEFTTVHDSFEKVLDMGRTNVLHYMAMSHDAVILDLRDLVKYQSTLPGKPELIAEIGNYVHISRRVSEELEEFHSHINQAVDKVIIINRFALRSLGDLKNRSLVAGHMATTFPWFFPHSRQPVTAGEIMHQYMRQATEIEERADSLIAEASVISLHLQNMEDSLEMMRQTANRDQASFIDKKEELFAKLWTKLGGNGKDRKRIEKNIAVSEKIREATRNAWIFVGVVVKELRSIKTNVNDLRNRVTGPQSRMALSADEIEEHVAFVQGALERLDKRREDGKAQQEAAISAALGLLNQQWKPSDSQLRPKRAEIPGK